MKVYVNGEPRELADSATVSDLLQAVAAPSQGVAVEVNQELVRRGDHPQHALSEGDRVEIVGLVGGG